MSHTPVEHRDFCVFEEHWYDRTVVIGCSGALDMLTAPELERRVGEAVQKRPGAVVIDLTAVDFLASAGMRVLIESNDNLTGEVEFAVVADGPFTRRPMTLVGLSDLFDMHTTLQDALDEFAGRAHGSAT
ncbi:MAG: STAS domain-containing protein [Mycobacterium sp.]